MCTNGVNTGQFEQMIEQIDDHVKLERRWAHTLGHMAGDAGFATVSEKMHAAQALLDDVRAMLDEAKDALEEDAEGASGVTVNLVSPGFIADDTVKAFPPALLDRIIESVPVGRLGTAKDLAGLCAWLASDEAAFVTGANYAINGGVYMS